MAQEIKYTSEYRVDCNKISIDLLKLLDKFLNEQNLICQNNRQRISFKCNSFELHETSFVNILNNEKFISNIDENFSITIIVFKEDLFDFFSLFITKDNNEIKISGSIKDINEHTVVGYKEVLEKFLKDNFIEEKVIEQEISDEDKQAENINNIVVTSINPVENKIANKTLVKKNLEWDIPSVKLTLEDLTEIEFILKQDLTDIEEYEINIEPNKKYLQKRTNAPKYTFNSVSQFQDYDDLVKNIKNYSIKFELRTAEISVNFGFSNEYSYLNKLYAYGGNQTLYYGKYKLLTDYLNIKKSWYAYIYNDKFLAIIFPVCSLLVAFWATYMGICISSKSWIKLILLLICAITFTLLLIFTPRILIKYNLKLQKNNKFWESSYFQIFAFIVSTLISIISIIIPIIIK